MIDIFECDGFIKSGVGIKVTLYRSKPSFYMLVGPKSRAFVYRFEISKLGLIVPIIKINDSLIPMLKTLCDKAPARYEFTSISIKSLNLQKDQQIMALQDVYSITIPQRTILAFYTEANLSGEKISNPSSLLDTLGFNL